MLIRNLFRPGDFNLWPWPSNLTLIFFHLTFMPKLKSVCLSIRVVTDRRTHRSQNYYTHHVTVSQTWGVTRVTWLLCGSLLVYPHNGMNNLLHKKQILVKSIQHILTLVTRKPRTYLRKFMFMQLEITALNIPWNVIINAWIITILNIFFRCNLLWEHKFFFIFLVEPC